ncbi:beta-L-arabinofuranosidase domain-containing protein [Ruminococcus sp.]|uniref:beta-L-arabinofuranosidase domain-containing protein n=1 Tax=Ruminococcus sp. TaxID=41978 RepID=UPI0025FD1A2F|nr:beta-L-arabinofuranosidase domain-containing protein [Ruminococcus sp.]
MLQKLPSRVTSFGIAAAMMFSFADLSAFKTSAATAEDMKIRDFSLSDITMTDEYSVNAFAQEIKYLLSFDNDRLLAGFRENAGLNTKGAKRYGGWENTNIAGHAIGHYLTALAQAYQHPDITDAQRSTIKSKMTTLIDGMRECQKNSKGKAGFVWAAAHPNGTSGEVQFDNIEAGKSNIINEAWVPWYTMHKLIAGIVDVYNATGYATAKDLGSDLGDWVYNRCKTWDQRKHNTVLSIEYGGMNDCLYDLYLITGKDNHAAAAHYFDETNLHETVLKGGANVLNNKHANTTIPKFLGALKRYIALDGKTVNGEKIDASRYLQYAEAFWDMVNTHHTYITGGNSEWEHFGMDDVLDKERTNCNCETCNSYNMLKLSRELFKITGDSKYMDFYENAYYNSILSSQNPETGMTTYFQPMATGYFKVYSSPFDHFWCCTGSGMESFTKLGDTIYMHGNDTLYVNMYQSSILNWADKNMKITQESSIPDGNTSKFTIDGSGAVDFRFRIPDWKAGNVNIKVDGEKYSYKTVNGYAQVTGEFKSGDVIEVTIPEAVKAYSLPDKNTVYGFKYGPVVLSAELGKQNMATGSTGMWVTIPKEAIAPSENIRISDNSTTVNTFMSEINDHLVKDTNSMKFTLKGTDHDLTFTPHYKQYQQRYGIYWNFQSSSTAVDRPVRSKKTVTDTVQPGYGQYENDNLHDMQEFNTQGVTDDSTYRYAKSGGSFSYRMAIDKEAEYNLLTVKFRKADNGKSIRIVVGDTILYSGTLDYKGSSDVYDVNLIVPQKVIDNNVKAVTADGADYDVLTVTFSSNDDKESAKVCDFIYMTAVKPLYEYDSSIAYFVDCGDHNTYTLSGNDKLGFYNSVTEQLYGPDEVTGAEWGLIDDPTDQYSGSKNSAGIYTANTWCDERNTGDGRAKNASFRYTKNQYENNIDRHLDYGFTLPNGKYSVEMCFSDPWSCSTSPTVYAYYGTDEQSVVAEKCATNGSTVTKGEVVVRSGRLDLNFRSADKAINLNYIIIREIEKDPLPTVTSTITTTTTVTTTTTTVVNVPQPTKLGDANCDSEVDMSDIVLIMQVLANPNKYGEGGTDKNAISKQGMINADVDTSSKGLTTGDALRIQKFLLGLVESLS